MSQIQSTLLSLWDDLRARRLVPVAALLVAALIAAPIVLSKKVDEPATPTAEQAATPSQADQPKGPEELAQVKLADQGVGTGSSLSAFDESNPFAPPQRVLEAAREAAQGGGGLTDLGSTGVTDTGSAGGTDTGGGETGTGDDGGGGGTETPDQGGGETETTQYAYVIDVTFWDNGRRRQIEGMRKLDQLPSAAAPVLIFMGASENGGNAVFLVDSTLETTGEGSCKPSRAECAFLYLGAGSEQEFTNDDGDSYRMRIDEIRKVKVDEGSGGKSAKNSKSKTARAAVGSPDEVRRFVPPDLVDLVVETSLGGDNSTGARERR